MKLPAALLFCAAAFAQSGEKPRFEIASIKPAAGGQGMFIRMNPGGRLSVSNMPLKELIVLAYRIMPFQISGGPPWIESARFDIEAKPEVAPKQGDIQPMLQALLAERFNFVLRRESREMPVYALVLARKDGKLGPKLTEPQTGSCFERDPTKDIAEQAKSGARPCGMMRMGLGEFTGSSIPLDNLCATLSRMLERTVINKTGLTGKYDVALEFAPDEARIASLPPDAPRPQIDWNGPTIFTAIQEQLGLKLEPQKGPVEVFVVERAEKPTEN